MVIGITGNSGSGKSEISKMLANKINAEIINADKVVRDMTNSQTEYFKKIMPTTCDDIERYLASGIIKGIRKATAGKIVEAFGEDSLKVISEDPVSLAKLKGISLQKAHDISKTFNTLLGTSELFMFLNKLTLKKTEPSLPSATGEITVRSSFVYITLFFSVKS